MRIKSINDLLPVIKDIQENLGLSGRVDYAEYYRGQSLNTYQLENGIGRLNYELDIVKRQESELFESFIDKVKTGKLDFIQEPYFKDKYPFIKEWFYHFQGQHIGITTRLMDWTNKWEIALLFAVNSKKNFGKDGQFWVFICPREYIINEPNLENIYNTHPLEIKNSFMINNPFYQAVEGSDYISEKRRVRQNGRFFTQSIEKSLIPLDEQEELKPFLHKYIIDGNSKERIVKELGKITTDWAYYRNDENITKEVDVLNKIITGKIS